MDGGGGGSIVLSWGDRGDAFDDVVRRALKTKAVELVRVILGSKVRRADELVAVALAFGGREYAVLASRQEGYEFHFLHAAMASRRAAFGCWLCSAAVVP